MKRFDLVVIGANAAGLSAASAARRTNSRFSIAVFEQSNWISVRSCAMPYFLSDEIKKLEDLFVYSRQYFKEKRQIDIYVQHDVVRIFPAKKTILVHDKSNATEIEIAYGKLVIATGAHPRSIAGIPREIRGFFIFRQFDHFLQVNQFLNEFVPRQVLIVGAGYLGIELAEALSLRGLSVRMIEQTDRVLHLFDPEFSKLAHETLASHHIEIECNRTILSAEHDRGFLTSVIFDDLRRYRTNFVIACSGINPASDIARESGIQTGVSGAIHIDRQMRTNQNDIYAAGDCAEVMSLSRQIPVYQPSAVVANAQGRIAGQNAAGRRAVFNGTVSPVIIRIFDNGLAATGLTDQEAGKLKIPFISATIRAKVDGVGSDANRKMHVKLTAHQQTLKIIGAQIFAPFHHLKKIDVISAAIIRKCSIEDLTQVDFAYSPAVSTYPDPWTLVAKQLLKGCE